MVSIIERHTQTDGTHSTAIPSLVLTRASFLSEPSLCFIAQGSKLVKLEQTCYRFDPATYLITSVQLPVVGQVIQASSQVPYLSLVLRFSSDQVLDIIKDVDPIKKEPPKKSRHGITVTHISPDLLDAVLRLVRLLDSPEDIQFLAPLIVREILYRVLQDKQGAIVKQFFLYGSPAQRVAKIIEFIP